MVDAVLAIKKPDQPADLHMVEMMEMQHKTDMDTQYVLRDVIQFLTFYPLFDSLVLHNDSLQIEDFAVLLMCSLKLVCTMQ